MNKIQPYFYLYKEGKGVSVEFMKKNELNKINGFILVHEIKKKYLKKK